MSVFGPTRVAPARTKTALFACLAAIVALLLAACGSGSRPTQALYTAPGSSTDDLAVSAASYDLAAGAPARFIAGLETDDRRLVTFGTVTMRFAFAGTGTAVAGKESTPAFGPSVTAAYLPVSGSEVPDPAPTTPRVVTASAARGVYGAMASFDRAGFWQVEVTAMIDGKPRRGTGAFQVLERHKVPAVGEPALATENLTLSAPPELQAAVDSRAPEGGIPDPELHRATIAAALAARRPVVAVFSTPVYCVSRFCGPVTDTIAALARRYGDRATFVHVEVWRDFQNKVINQAAADWLLRDDDLTEPWVFVVGADGRIAARFDNVVTPAELEPLLQALPVIGPDPAEVGRP